MNGPGDRRWFKASPERLDWELERLKEADVAFSDPTEDVAGNLYIPFELDFDGKTRDFRLEYPSAFPYFAPKVFGPPGLLKRHQNPNGGHLCVVDDDDSWWHPGSSGAWLVIKLKELLAASDAGDEEVRDHEAAMPEPFTGHFSMRPGKVILVPDLALEDNLGAQRGRFVLSEVSTELQVMTQLTLPEGHPQHLDPEIFKAVGGEAPCKEIDGEWFDLDSLAEAADWREVVESASKALQSGARTFRRGRGGKRRLRGSTTAWIGITFFEEGPAQGQRRRAWLFFELRDPSKGSDSVVGDQPIGTQALSEHVRRQRTHELTGLEDASFLVVGGGSIGSSMALELAKADAGQLNLIDDDTYDANNAVRHILPVGFAGENKAKALATCISTLNPFIDVIAHEWDVGDDGRLDETITMIEASTVVIDATGAPAVTRLLHHHCVRLDTPLVSVAMTPGAYGGRVLVLRRASPCLDCFYKGQEEGSIPKPPEAPASTVTPYGCSHPAASGAGFDVSELAAIAVRKAVQVSDVVEYPRDLTDWIVVSFRDRPPDQRFQTGALVPHSDCEICS